MNSMTHPFRALGHLCDQHWSVSTYKWGTATEKSDTLWTLRSTQMNYRLASYWTTWEVANFDFHIEILKNGKGKNVGFWDPAILDCLNITCASLTPQGPNNVFQQVYGYGMRQMPENSQASQGWGKKCGKGKRHLVVHLMDQQAFQGSFCSWFLDKVFSMQLIRQDLNVWTGMYYTGRVCGYILKPKSKHYYKPK